MGYRCCGRVRLLAYLVVRMSNEQQQDDFKRFSDALAYDPEAGILTWKICKGGGSPRIGGSAGCVNPRGYLNVRLNRKTFKAHRIAWLLTTGAWPKCQIDHINGDKTDNRIANLRDVPAYVNNLNKLHVLSCNELGAKGVSRSGNKFRAIITARNKRYHLGCFATVEEASKAYKDAVLQLHVKGIP